MNFILKLAYKVTEKKRLIYMHLLLLFIVLCGLPGQKKIDSSRICSSVYIILRPVYMHYDFSAVQYASYCTWQQHSNGI